MFMAPTQIKLHFTSGCHTQFDSWREPNTLGNQAMTGEAISRRILVGAGTCVVAAAGGTTQIAHAQAGKPLSPESEQIIRKHYQAWVEKDWHAEDMLLTDDFTFSSAAGDDHISKSTYKERCWDTQAKNIKRSDLLRIFGSGNEAFVMYDCLTTKGNTFRNVEYFELRAGKISSIVCYFGSAAGFPTAANARHG
jgi:hypothetical protein